MIKQLGLYVIGFGLLSLIGYYLHISLFPKIASESPILLSEVYAFFSIFSLILCILLLRLSKTEKFKDQLGFLYLASVALKIMLFCFTFYRHIFIKGSFTSMESVNLLIPMILCIILEVFFISKILKNTSVLKNTK